MIHEVAPAKVNLVLQVGNVRDDGLHELCSLFASLDLADEVTVDESRGADDEVTCAGVTGPNLATRALAELRAALDPAPTKVVANLPYGVAATVILQTIEQLPGVGAWVGMVQREVGERFAASPGSPSYGVPSVLAQLACEVRVLRRVPATVFHPAPNVVSALVLLKRVSPSPPRAVIDLIHASFAHRRKALAGSLALSPGGDAGLRDRAREALAGLGHPPDVRAERLSPADFARLADMLGWPA